ncbi:MAG: hypothetical protein NXI15_13945 [Gammaproteobacteria bacterium]|nr:hypothetical protein [Gammaproteobacteria bacterium]
MNKLFRSAMLVCMVMLSSALQAQDISGEFVLDVRQDPGAGDCIWNGDIDFVQSGGNPGTFTGAATLALVSGSGCTGFSGVVTGNINGSTLDIGVGISGLGTATFSGTVVNPDRLEGSWSGLGVSGTWSADRVPVVLPPSPPPVDAVNPTAVPALPLPGLVLLTLLVAGLGVRFSTHFKRKR